MSRSNTCKKLRKCAKNPFGPKQLNLIQHLDRRIQTSTVDPKDFLHEVQFSAAIEAAHFPAVETGHWPAVSCHFHQNINEK
jgi:hypothetical protein